MEFVVHNHAVTRQVQWLSVSVDDMLRIHWFWTCLQNGGHGNSHEGGGGGQNTGQYGARTHDIRVISMTR